MTAANRSISLQFQLKRLPRYPPQNIPPAAPEFINHQKYKKMATLILTLGNLIVGRGGGGGSNN